MRNNERAVPTESAGPTQTLAGRVAIVTGAGRGVGRATALALAHASAAVAAVARTAAEVEETAELIRRDGGSAFALPADVTDRRAVEELALRIQADLGPVDILVNNAGRFRAIGPLWEVDPEEWWRDVEVNLLGAFLCTRAVLPQMVARNRGRIINVASNAAIQTGPYSTAYSASKAALLRLTDSLAAATSGQGIYVFAISPGRVRTAMAEYLITSPAGQKWLPHWQTMPARDLVPPERAARLVVFLASGLGDTLSGRYIHVSDDVEDLVRRAEEIRRHDLHTLRLRK